MILAGAPATTHFRGTLSVTTEWAPIIEPKPTVTPFITDAPYPTQTCGSKMTSLPGLTVSPVVASNMACSSPVRTMIDAENMHHSPTRTRVWSYARTNVVVFEVAPC